MTTPLDAILSFLDAIGIPSRPAELPEGTFLPAVAIDAGPLVYDPQRLRWPGDLLHEAGHIAVTPPAARAGLSGALEGSEAAPHGGEVEAIAWSWAAAMHLGLAPQELFHPDGYKGQSAGLLLSYSLGVWPGAFGLAQAGMTLVGETAQEAGVPPYPRMRALLRPS